MKLLVLRCMNILVAINHYLLKHCSWIQEYIVAKIELLIDKLSHVLWTTTEFFIVFVILTLSRLCIQY